MTYFPLFRLRLRPGRVGLVVVVGGGGGDSEDGERERQRFHGCTGSFSARAFVWQPLLLQIICTSIKELRQG